METIKTDLHPDCTNFEVDLKSKVLIQYFEPEKAGFNRGDYVASGDMIMIADGYPNKHIARLHNKTYITFDSIYEKFDTELFRLATDEEINRLDSLMLEHGYIFNKTTLELEKVHKFKQGDAVLVRDDDYGEWEAKVFKSYNADGSDYIYSTYLANWKQCIPFDPELEGTTNKQK